MRDLASFADVNRPIQGSLTPYLEILSNISVINDCGRNLKAMHNIAGYLYPIHGLFVLLLCNWIINPIIITITIPQI